MRSEWIRSKIYIGKFKETYEAMIWPWQDLDAVNFQTVSNVVSVYGGWRSLPRQGRVKFLSNILQPHLHSFNGIIITSRKFYNLR